jgi:hypothetical protein
MVDSEEGRWKVELERDTQEISTSSTRIFLFKLKKS